MKKRIFGFFLTKRFLFFSLIFLGLSLLYAVPRLILFKSPSFVDEYIYTRWAQQGYFNAADRLVSLHDGKQPFFIWLISLTMLLYPNPLIAGKLVSFVAGFGTMIGVGYLSYLLFKRRLLTFLSMLLYALFPFAVIYDHLAIYDGIVGFFYIWSIILAILIVRKPSLGKAFIFANFLSASLLTKSTTILSFLLIPLAFFFEYRGKYKKVFFSILGYTVLIIILSFIYQSILYLSPSSDFVSTRNSEFVRSFSNIVSLKGILESISNIKTLIGWIVTYLSIPISIFVLLPFFINKLRNRFLFFLLGTFIIPFLIFCFMGTNIFPRHIFFFVIPLLILAATGIEWIFSLVKNPFYCAIILVVVLSEVLYINYRMTYNLPTAPIPAIETFQLANGWPSGYGIREVMHYLTDKSKEGQIAIAAEGKYGSLPFTASQLYFSQFPSVHITAFDEKVSTKVPLEIKDMAKAYPVYVIFNKVQKIPDWSMEKILEVRKGVGANYMRLYLYKP